MTTRKYTLHQCCYQSKWSHQILRAPGIYAALVERMILQYLMSLYSPLTTYSGSQVPSNYVKKTALVLFKINVKKTSLVLFNLKITTCTFIVSNPSLSLHLCIILTPGPSHNSKEAHEIANANPPPQTNLGIDRFNPED